MWLLSAFIIGIVGSFHCAGMCGPIALALPIQQKSFLSILNGRLLYNSGRLITYGILGLILGIIGHTFSLAGWQKPLSIFSGIIVLLAVLIPVSFKKLNFLQAVYNRYSGKIRKSFQSLFSRRSQSTLFFIGMLNGILPCGMVYLALAGAVAGGTLMSSVEFMIMFGLGTWPVMMALSLAPGLFGPSVRNTMNRLSPWLAVSVAILLIARGLMATGHSCCH